MAEIEMRVAPGEDGKLRCGWGLGTPDYVAYHDEEWGRALHGDVALYERLTLEAFQSGLSWLTILRKRENFRAAFDGFEPEKVASYGKKDFERLMADAGIVRNRMKIEAAITNAGALLELQAAGETLDGLLWGFAPDHSKRKAPRSLKDLDSTTPESKAMAKELKRRGFVFVGPTTAYALMQAVGMVNDHLEGCEFRAAP
jgi:DNA-3-methyladenine glycosylase I